MSSCEKRVDLAVLLAGVSLNQHNLCVCVGEGGGGTNLAQWV